MLRLVNILCVSLIIIALHAEAQTPLALSFSVGHQQGSSDDWSTGNFERLEGFTIRRVELLGNRFIRDEVLHRAANLREGNFFTVRALRRGLKQLNSLGVFEKVTEQNVKWQADNNLREVDFVISVTEKPRRK
ncbi:MAG: hypothetical protein QOC96_1168 [Acidobacteriota bacterium]|jgi:hypothetical protein|nr:hypothetical protein [Acidobacteriota bacterium]